MNDPLEDETVRWGSRQLACWFCKRTDFVKPLVAVMGRMHISGLGESATIIRICQECDGKRRRRAGPQAADPAGQLER